MQIQIGGIGFFENKVNVSCQVFNDNIRGHLEITVTQEEYKEAFANPFKAAARGFVDRVILPEETRPALYQALIMTETKSELRPKRKHGILPH